jgi:hypothetical protein
MPKTLFRAAVAEVVVSEAAGTGAPELPIVVALLPGALP